MIEYLKDWLVYLHFGWMQIIISLVIFVTFSVVSLLFVSAVLVRLPATYFCDSHSRALWTNRHPVIRWMGLIVKNLTGVLLVMLGIVLTMPGIPGPGLLTVVIGALLLDIPGKRRAERWLISRPSVLSTINGMRAKHGKEPLVLDPVDCGRAPDL